MTPTISVNFDSLILLKLLKWSQSLTILLMIGRFHHLTKWTLLAVISTETKNILPRHFYMRTEEKLRSKRAASESLTPEQVRKHPRSSTSEARLQCCLLHPSIVVHPCTPIVHIVIIV